MPVWTSRTFWTCTSSGRRWAETDAPRPCVGLTPDLSCPSWRPGHHRRHPHTQTHARAGGEDARRTGGEGTGARGGRGPLPGCRKEESAERAASLLPPLPCCPPAGGGPRGWALVTQEVGGARHRAPGPLGESARARSGGGGVPLQPLLQDPHLPCSSQLRDWAALEAWSQERGPEWVPACHLLLRASPQVLPLSASGQGEAPRAGAVWPQGPTAPVTAYPRLLCWAEETGVPPVLSGRACGSCLRGEWGSGLRCGPHLPSRTVCRAGAESVEISGRYRSRPGEAWARVPCSLPTQP